MAYTKTDWVDGTTPLNEANLDKIEQGVYDAHQTADGAVQKAIVDAKGDLIVASAADAVVRLPVGVDGQALVADAAQAAGVKWATPAAAGGGTDWEGAYSPATAYVKGDVVTYNGVTYVAVNDSTGQTPPALPAPPTGAAGVIPLVTTLAGLTPFDGMEVILVDSLTAPTYQWRLRYVAAKASNKWLFVGGSAAYSKVDTSETTTSLTYADLATVGPQFTVPVAGDYQAVIDAEFEIDVTGNTGIYAALKVGAAATSDANRIGAHGRDAAAGRTHHPSATLRITAAAADVLKMQYRGQGAGTFRYLYRHLSVQPVAVGG